MKNKVITFSLLGIIVAIWNQTAIAQCPDVTCTTLAITNLTGKDISYAFEIKNIGTDTLFLSKVVFQNYVKPDSSTSTSNAFAAGGAFVFHGSSDFLLPGKKLTGDYYANSNFATVPCPFLLLSLSYTGKTECKTDNNYTVKRLVLEPTIAAQFKADVTSGTAPFTVHFSDMSTNKPTQWKWDFNNDGKVDSTSQNPSFVYNTPGTYSVKLIASKVGSSDSIAKTTYITVNQQLPSGIESLENDECSVYPNPSNGLMYVKLGEKISRQSVVIETYDNTGKMTLSVKSVDKPEIKLDLSPFQVGPYTIKVICDHKVLTKKVIRK